MSAAQGASNSAGRAWEFTLNNPKETEVEYLRRLGKEGEVAYLVFGREEGEKGTPHLQGRVIMKRNYRLTQLKKIFPRFHLEKTKALADNIYLKKCLAEGREYEEFENRAQGKRNDITELLPLAKEGKFKDAADLNPTAFAKYEQFLRRYSGLANINVAPRNPAQPPTVYWLHGPAGAGKTRAVWTRECEISSSPSLWMSGSDLTYMDGYENQEAVCIDDFRPEMCKLTHLLRLTDRYPLRVSVKHSSREWNPSRIYITASAPPGDYFATYNDAGTKDQLLRRLTKIIKVQPGKEVEW